MSRFQARAEHVAAVRPSGQFMLRTPARIVVTALRGPVSAAADRPAVNYLATAALAEERDDGGDVAVWVDGTRRGHRAVRVVIAAGLRRPPVAHGDSVAVVHADVGTRLRVVSAGRTHWWSCSRREPHVVGPERQASS